MQHPLGCTYQHLSDTCTWYSLPHNKKPLPAQAAHASTQQDHVHPKIVDKRPENAQLAAHAPAAHKSDIRLMFFSVNPSCSRSNSAYTSSVRSRQLCPLHIAARADCLVAQQPPDHRLFPERLDQNKSLTVSFRWHCSRRGATTPTHLKSVGLGCLPRSCSSSVVWLLGRKRLAVAS